MHSAFVLFLLVRLHAGVFVDSRRPTRILGGDKITDFDQDSAPLKVLQYFVWIGKAWDRSCAEGAFCHFFGACLFSKRLVPWFGSNSCPLEDPNRLHCGGTLIAPRIVQTACHCVADTVGTSRSGLWREAAIYNYWETQYFIYMGISKVLEFRYPIKSLRFFANINCGKLTRKPRPTRYDVGWILLEDEVDSSIGVTGRIWGNIDYAGPYKQAELINFSEQVIAQRQVCLVTGYGRTKPKVFQKSLYLKYGWIQIYDFEHCYDITWPSRLRQRVDYNTSFSWVCYRPLHDPYNPPNIAAQHLSGDSGSPVTCDNNYFALVSGRSGFKSHEILGAGEYNISKIFAIYYHIYSVAVEYRREFEEALIAASITGDSYEGESSSTAETTSPNDRELTVFPSTNGTIPHPNIKLWVTQSSGTRFHLAWTFFLYVLQAIAKHNHP